MILPFMDQANLYNQYNWSTPSGRASHGSCSTAAPSTDQYSIVTSPVTVFLCPSDPGNPSHRTTSADYYVDSGWRTSYGVVNYTTGGGGGSWKANGDTRKGTLGPNGAAQFRDITDGTSNTMVFCETKLNKTSTSYGPYWNAATHTFFILPGSSSYRINYNYDGNNNQYAWGAGSHHVGGAHILLGDGGVRFLSENVDLVSVVQALISIKGGEVVPEF